jgi:hypothetical protein
MRAVQNRAVEHAGQRNVIDEFRAARDELRVFDALHRLANPFRLGDRQIVYRLRELECHQLVALSFAAALCTDFRIDS